MPLHHRTLDKPTVRPRRIDATNLCLLFAAALATLPWIFGRELPGSNPSAALRDLSKDTSFAVTDPIEPPAPRVAATSAAGGANVQLAAYAP